MNKKIVLVSGASKGIGQGICEKFIESGEYIVVGTTRHKENLDSMKESGIIPMILDVCSQQSVDELYTQLKTEKLLPDILINNSGVATLSPLAKIKDEDLHTVMNTNFYGVYRLTKKFILNMVRNKFGRIINISSVLSKMPQKGFSHYSASKGAIESFSRVIALEYASKNITVNCIAPGFVDTDILGCLGNEGREMAKNKIPVKEMTQPYHIGTLAHYIASENAKHITGEIININGGLYIS